MKAVLGWMLGIVLAVCACFGGFYGYSMHVKNQKLEAKLAENGIELTTEGNVAAVESAPVQAAAAAGEAIKETATELYEQATAEWNREAGVSSSTYVGEAQQYAYEPGTQTLTDAGMTQPAAAGGGVSSIAAK